MDRRQFLGTLALAGVTVACSSDSDDGNGSATRVTLATPALAAVPDGLFALGVASGDPLADRVMLWTRLATDPAAAPPADETATGDTAPSAPTTIEGDVEVAFDVATDVRFEHLVVSDVAIARPALGHSVHVDVGGLAPDTWYYYRFRAGGQTSPVGRTRTFPASGSDPDQFRFVFASCQDYQWGRYGAWGRAAEIEDVDAVVFLGDYIYELRLGDLSPDGSGDRVWLNDEPQNLDDYRLRYAQTKTDPQLQAAHHMAPWIVTFDDHEVSNNYAGDVGQADVDQPNSRNRRLAAYQAWYEHTPIRVDPEPVGQAAEFDDVLVHRSARFGDLATLFAIETRQHADVPACRTGGDLLSDEGPACPELFDDDRTNLGEIQESWLIESLQSSDATWNILANPLMLAGLNVGTEAEPARTRDTWDGYPAARRRLLEAIKEGDVSNPVVVTGDWHASFVLDVRENPEDPDSPTLMPEFLASSISTVLFSADHTAANPHVRYFVAEHGFGLVTVTPDELTCEFHYVADVWDADTETSHVDSWVVAAGEREARPA